VDGDGVDDLAAPLAIGAAPLALSHPALGSQMFDELPVESAFGLQVQAPINRLVRDAHFGVATVLRGEPASDLLGRPVFLQFRSDELPSKQIYSRVRTPSDALPSSKRDRPPELRGTSNGRRFGRSLY